MSCLFLPTTVARNELKISNSLGWLTGWLLSNQRKSQSLFTRRFELRFPRSCNANGSKPAWTSLDRDTLSGFLS